jgi:dihydroneopterin aldolase
MDRLTIQELAVNVRLGVPDAERARPQTISITIEMRGDFEDACRSDDIRSTVDYFQMSLAVRQFCAEGEWRLVEKLAHDVAGLVLTSAGVRVLEVAVELRKYIIAEARHISFRCERAQADFISNP